MSVVETINLAQIEEAKSSQGGFELPCGYLAPDGVLHTSVIVREISGHEEDMLGSKAIPGGKKLAALLTRCTEQVGPFSSKEKIAEIIQDLPVGDRVFLLFAIRRVTLGDMYPFEEKCPECERMSVYTVSLAEMEIKKMPTPEKRVYDIKLPSGKTARFHVMTGREEEKMQNLDKSLDGVSLALLARLDLLDDKPPTLAEVKGLGMRDRNALRDAFQEVEGGVETSVEVTCSACGHEFEREMSVDRSFFSPSALQKGSKRKSSS